MYSLRLFILFIHLIHLFCLFIWAWLRACRACSACLPFSNVNLYIFWLSQPRAISMKTTIATSIIGDHPMAKIPKLQKLQKIQELQNMNYVTYTYYKIKIGFFLFFCKYSKNPIVFWHFWCVLYNKLLFWISDSESAYLTLYRNMG